MQIYTLRCTILSSTNLADTFRVFEDPYNLAKITPPWLHFVVTNKDRVRMAPGAEIAYDIRWLGIPMHWKTLIREYDPPVAFVDEQAKGPYTLWRHHHTFEQTPEGTLVGDRVNYALPLGILGRLAHAAMIKRQLLEIFAYRQRTLGGLLGGTTRQILPPHISAASSSELDDVAAGK